MRSGEIVRGEFLNYLLQNNKNHKPFVWTNLNADCIEYRIMDLPHDGSSSSSFNDHYRTVV
jgi:hypothetical protein